MSQSANLKEQAKILRLQKLSCTQIGKILGKHTATICRWLNPERTKINIRRNRDSIRGRLCRKLVRSRLYAKHNGNIPCAATIDELVVTLVDKCQGCQRSTEKTGPLCLDHCHKTGKFRAWLCHDCNKILQRSNDTPDTLLRLAKILQDNQNAD